MGDRANVAIPQEEMGVNIYLYTHWRGTELPGIVQKALARRVRWNDQAYLARIIFDQMTEGAHGAETGYGISAYISDGGDRVIYVDTHKQEVRIQAGDSDGAPRCFTFEQFVALEDPEWDESEADG